MPNKYLQLGTTGFPEEATFTDASSGAGDAGKGIALNSQGKLDSTLFPAGLGADSKALTAGEALSAGNLVYIDSATGKVFKADGTNIAKAAVGFVLSAAALNAPVTIYFEGTITGLAGLTVGSMYFLNPAAAGGVTTTVTTTAGQIVQRIGYAISATEINFEAGEPIKRA